MQNSLLPTFNSSPIRAYKSIFEVPNWVGNLLWLSLAGITSGFFIGQIGLLGFGSELLQKRAGRPEAAPQEIDSTRLGDYISKGIWPFLVQLIVQLVISVIILVPILVIIAVAAAIGASAGGEEALAISFLLALPILLGLGILANVIGAPFVIRAMVCQDFTKSFDVAWVLGFTRLMFWEIIISGFLFWLLSLVIIAAGTLLFCVGSIPATGIVMGGSMHLMSQWYEIYLSRGGVPAPAPADDILEATMI